MYWLGIDGGGTKTEYILTDEAGNILAQKRTGTISYKQIGKEKCIDSIRLTIEEMLGNISFAAGSEIYACCALPNYGESREADEFLRERIEADLGIYHMYLVNDCQVGWAGSLGLEPGINLVAGTGAIGYGQDMRGCCARAGGWNEDFSDEGSCVWLGRKAMELFSKESDGREPSGALLKIVREHFSLQEDMDIVDIYEAQCQSDRTEKAALQKLLLEAARKGDSCAINAYRSAARELALIVLAIYEKLQFEADEKIKVSYSGGLFHAENYILSPLKEELSPYPFQVMKPLFSPSYGAVLLAASYWGDKKKAERLKMKWLGKV